MPMMFPIQTKMKAYLSFFKVPLRTLWKDYMDFISSDHTEEFVPPYMNFKASDIKEGGALKPSGLGDCFGIPSLDMTFGYLPQGSISPSQTIPPAMSTPSSNRSVIFNNGTSENYYKGGDVTFALGNYSVNPTAGYQNNGDCVVWGIPLNQAGVYWRYQSLGHFDLSYVGDSHGEPFVAEFEATAKIGLSGDSAQSFKPMDYLKKCQNARIVYSTAPDPESGSSPQAFTSVGIDAFNNPYSVNESTQIMTVIFRVRVAYSSSSDTPRITFGFVCPPVTSLVSSNKSTLLKLVDLSLKFSKFIPATSDTPIS